MFHQPGLHVRSGILQKHKTNMINSVSRHGNIFKHVIVLPSRLRCTTGKGTVIYNQQLQKLGKLAGMARKLMVGKFVKKSTETELGSIVCDDLKDMGPTFVKIGQFMSTRSDIFGKDFTAPLTSLQDKVSPMNSMQVQEMINALEAMHPNMFQFISPEPIAAASIGQVHYAKLLDGSEVVIKFKRYNIDKTIRDDFTMLLGIISFIKMFSQHRQVQEIEISLKEYYALLLEEIDFQKEASNMQRFARQFEGTKWIKVPKTYREMCSDDMIVMEYVPSIKINDVAEIERNKLKKEVISQKLLECFFSQIVEHGFVHIDPHPGNVGINATTGKIVFYDYGMFVELNGILKDNIKQLMLAMYDRDIDDVCNILVNYDIIKLEPSRAPYFKKFIASFLVYLDNLDVKDFKVSYLDRIDQSEMQFLISSKFVLLLRGISIMEGNCKLLDPEFNYRAVLDPFLNDFVIDISYIERRGNKDLERFTKTSDRIVTSEISLGMVENDLAALKAKHSKDMTKQRIIMIVLFVALAFNSNMDVHPLSFLPFLCFLYSK